MDFLSNLYVPETAFQFFVVKFGLFLSYLLILPFLSVLIGTLFFSLLHVQKSNIYKNSNYLNFAEYLARVVLKKLGVKLLLGVLPFLGFVFFYAQMFASEVKSIENLTLGFLLFVAGLFLASIYLKSFNRIDIRNIINTNAEIDNNKSRFGILPLGGWIGLLLILASALFLVGYSQNMLIPDSVRSLGIFNSVFTSSNFLFIILFLTITFALTSAIILGRMNRTKENYPFKTYAKEFAVKTGAIFSVVQPVIFVAYIFSVNVEAFSIGYLLTSFIILATMLIISIQFYLNYQNRNLKGTLIVFVFLLLFSLLIYNSQLASENSNKEAIIKNSNEITIF